MLLYAPLNGQARFDFDVKQAGIKLKDAEPQGEEMHATCGWMDKESIVTAVKVGI